jgi:hypothetical protein
MANTPKRYSPDSLRRRTLLLPICVVLIGLVAFLQAQIDPDAKQYHEGEKSIGAASTGLNNEFLLLPLLGFREAAAGLLWVRCDEFFHSGDYDAILPLVRLITWLDPHADNVYVTGAWHLSYNFTDSSERSDRRYISPSEALLDEGIRYNMNIPDIKFEKGWQNYDKIKDFVAAAKAFLMAINGPVVKNSDDYPYAAPLKTLHILAHTYEKQARIPEALDEWQLALDRSTKMMQAKPDDYGLRQMHAAEQHNYKETLQRYHDRYTTTDHEINKSPYPAVIKPAGHDKTPRPWDTVLQPKVEIVRPKVFKISGRFNVADGARVEVRITDWDYKERPVVGVLDSFDIDMSQTILLDSISVRKNKFEREMDMSKDPKMYSFSNPTGYYRVQLTFNPRITSPHVHDRFGWSGEGMTDSNAAHVYVDRREPLLGTTLIQGQGGEGPIWDGKTIPWPQHGQPIRMVRVTYKITKEQILNQKPITDADIVPNE